jgi:glyoxylate/hydroxypyruvate reductase A
MNAPSSRSAPSVSAPDAAAPIACVRPPQRSSSAIIYGRMDLPHYARSLPCSRRSPRTVEGVRTFSGRDGLDIMLRATDILVSLLPLTSETRGLVDATLLARLPQGARFINVGRGAQVVEADLIAALDSGQLAHATLDVFTTEPLPADHPFWDHPRITITPHIASLTVPETAAGHVAATLAAARAGQALAHAVDRQHGY